MGDAEGSVWRGVLKVTLATLLFGVVHSYLANPHAEAVATTLVGKRAVAGLYRPSYVLLSVVMTAGLSSTSVGYPDGTSTGSGAR